MTRVRVDPGHASPLPTGGTDPGAVGNGVREAECVLEISKLVAAMLRASGVRVDLTRTGEPGPTAAQRAKLLSVAGVDCSVSIHANAAADPAARGVEIYVSAANAESQLLGTAIAEEYLAWVQGIPGRQPVVRTPLASNGEDYYYFVRHPTRAGIPAVLVEVGFVSSAEDAAVLASFWGRFAIAYGISRGVLRWLGRLAEADELADLRTRMDQIRTLAEGR